MYFETERVVTYQGMLGMVGIVGVNLRLFISPFRVKIRFQANLCPRSDCTTGSWLSILYYYTSKHVHMINRSQYT
jgi:hypothetical protein